MKGTARDQGKLLPINISPDEGGFMLMRLFMCRPISSFTVRFAIFDLRYSNSDLIPGTVSGDNEYFKI